MEYAIKILEDKKSRLLDVIRIVEEDRVKEFKDSTALGKCVRIFQNDCLLRFAITGDEIIRQTASVNVCAEEDMMKEHFDKTVHFVQKGLHSETEDVGMKDVNLGTNIDALRGMMRN